MQTLLLAVLVMAPVAAHAATQTKIFFVSDRDTTTSIWTADGDGANPVKLIPNATDPALSLDGTRLAFARNGDIYIAKVGVSGGAVFYTGLDNGASPTALTNDGGANIEASPSFSPSGSRLIFERGPVADPDLFLINSDGSSSGVPTSAFARTGAANSPRFVSDTQIVFAAKGAAPLDPSFNSLVTFVLGSATNSFGVEEAGSTSTNSITRLTVSPLGTPIGKKVVFSRFAAPTRGLLQDNLNQTTASTFSSSLPGDNFPSFSPDGTKIIFSSTNTGTARGNGVGGASEVFLLNADGSAVTRLTTDAANDFAPVIGDITVSGALAAPTITNFTPINGPIGTSVVITGTNFTGATSVKFNGTAAVAYTVDSATQITATVPTGATTGTISVTTPGGTATSATAFTVTPNTPPTLSNMTFTAGINVPFSAQLNGSDANGDTLNYATIDVLPAGLNLSSAGVLSGTPSAAGTSRFSVTVTDGKGGSATANFAFVVRNLAVGTDSVAPDITRSAVPASGTRADYAALTFSGNVTDKAQTGVTPSGVNRVLIQLRSGDNKQAYDGTAGFTTNLTKGYYVANLGAGGAGATRTYDRALSFFPSTLTPGNYILLLYPTDIAGNYSAEYIGFTIVAPVNSPVAPVNSPSLSAASKAPSAGSGGGS